MFGKKPSRLVLNVVSSALSLRLFGADITTAGRDIAQQKQSAAASGSGTPALAPDDMILVQESDILETAT